MPQELKRCSSGDLCLHPDGPYLPATAEFFYPRKKGFGRFTSHCRLCQRAKTKLWREKNPERRKMQLDKWREENYERTLELNRQSNARNKARIKKWNQDHKEQVNLKNRMVRAKKPDLYKALGRSHDLRRRSRKRNLPSNYSVADWQRALDYFHGCCAVCGNQLSDLFGTTFSSADHWIPLSNPNCPGTVPTNMIPLCHGLGGCNNSKTNKNPVDWLNERFGKRRAKQILRRVNEFFTYIKSLEDD